MSFQSIHFAVYLAALFLLTRYVLKSNASRKNLLLLASVYFYSCWDWRFPALLLGVAIYNYFLGRRIAEAASQKARRLYLTASLAGSLGVLGVFKYLNFLLESVNRFAAMTGLEGHINLLNVILPVGISFYTFHCLSYTIDIYRKHLAPIGSLRDFLLFVTFFPPLVAGPIVRAVDFLPQLRTTRTATDEEILQGFSLILRGLLKKVVFADTLGLHFVDPAFASPAVFSSPFLIASAFAYSLQVYMDFSGYTDIARGSARLLGYELPVNFRSPYRATSVSDFWQRWHISMSSFFRDYLYFGLGGSRRGNVYVNLLITFLAIGLWHGAGWNFFAYGAVQGGMVCLERFLRARRGNAGVPEPDYSGFFTRSLCVIGTFTFVSAARILFRAPDLQGAWSYLKAIFHPGDAFFTANPAAISLLVLAFALHYVPYRVSQRVGAAFMASCPAVQSLVVAAILLLLVIFGEGNAPFIYFQF